ncbi:transposase [Nonomuraea sp. NPDC050153]|uniref:transposase n=1 Tax=Nonomuraea sp. NPDC050153 TaxID=3364359 RepID=UPI0037AACF5F
MARGDLTDEQWAVLGPLLSKNKNSGRSPVRPRRQLIDGIRFRVRTGIPWRDMPEEYGPWVGCATCSGAGSGTAPPQKAPCRGRQIRQARGPLRGDRPRSSHQRVAMTSTFASAEGGEKASRCECTAWQGATHGTPVPDSRRLRC